MLTMENINGRILALKGYGPNAWISPADGRVYVRNKIFSGIDDKGLDIFWTVTIHEIIKELGLPRLPLREEYEQGDLFR